MRRLFVIAGLLFSASGFAQTPSQTPSLQERLNAAAADPAALRQAIDGGKKVTAFCANCHGDNGVSTIPEVPNLAGQNPAYLLDQMRKFASGERKNQFMEGLIKVLKDDERQQAVLFYANQPVLPSQADPALVARGKILYVKLCARCHEADAHGDKLMPRLAGQQMPYLQASIKNYSQRTGARVDKLMSIATSALKKDDVTAVASYLTQLP
jgi:cytochrome c553